jgi:DNA-binding transcriptional ArsR family regulator
MVRILKGDGNEYSNEEDRKTEIDHMKTISEEVRLLIDSFKAKGIITTLNVDEENGIVRIYLNNTNELKRALSAVSEILDLAYSTTEHHPYSLLLYHSTEILRSVLDAWGDTLTADGLSEIAWRVDEIRSNIERISKSDQW